MPSIRKDQTSSCPDGWLKAGIKVPVNLTGAAGEIRRPLHGNCPLRVSISW